MLRVEQPPVPEKLSRAAEDELSRLKAKLERQEPLTMGDFRAYKSAGVREALNTRFRFKCAYCESFYGATQPVAIEHYRPKAKVKTSRGDKPGYYWLAARWLNLLPSCTDCNSERKHVLLDEQVTVGKGNQFPIVDEARRARAPDEERNEGRLLLHPYLDRPERHLEFDSEGLVRARRSGGRTSRKGRTSIDVYALQRPILVQARVARQLLVRGQMNVVAREARRLEADPSNAEQQRILDEEVAKLRSFCAESEPYTAMARQMIEPFMDQLLA
jgi:uncharacterized protein (TIGR02646 family)